MNAFRVVKNKTNRTINKQQEWEIRDSHGSCVAYTFEGMVTVHNFALPLEGDEALSFGYAMMDMAGNVQAANDANAKR